MQIEPNIAADYVKTVHKMMATRGAGIPISYQVLYEYGRTFTPQSVPHNEMGAQKNCYQNAYQLAMFGDRNLTYCEGYACSKALGIPLEHAWTVDENGIVVDPTWELGSDYFGVAFSIEKLSEITALSGHYGIFCNLFLFKMAPDELTDLLTTGLTKHGG